MKRILLYIAPLLLLSCSNNEVEQPTKSVKFSINIPANELTISCEKNNTTFRNVTTTDVTYNLPYGHHTVSITADSKPYLNDIEVSATSPTQYTFTTDANNKLSIHYYMGNQEQE